MYGTAATAILYESKTLKWKAQSSSFGKLSRVAFTGTMTARDHATTSAKPQPIEGLRPRRRLAWEGTRARLFPIGKCRSSRVRGPLRYCRGHGAEIRAEIQRS